MRIEWISDPLALELHEGAWRNLEAAVERRTHVSTFDFLATWYRHYAGGYGGTPLVGLAWNTTDLLGVAPLTIRRGRLGRVPVTRIDFAPNDSIAGEFLVRENRADVVRELLDSLAARVKFDVICLNGFEPDSPELRAIHDAAGPRLATGFEDHAFALVDVSQGYDRYWASLDGNVRRKIASRARKIETRGAVVTGVVPAEVRQDLDARIRRMIAINEASYKLEGARLADHHRGFLTELAHRFAARGMLSLPILSIGGRDAAYIIGVVERGCFYDVTLAYDESFASLGPGMHLMQQALRRLAASGVHTVVSHGAHEYKRQWATRFVPQKRIFLFSARPFAVAARLVRFGLQPILHRRPGPAGPGMRGASDRLRALRSGESAEASAKAERTRPTRELQAGR